MTRDELQQLVSQVQARPSELNDLGQTKVWQTKVSDTNGTVKRNYRFSRNLQRGFQKLSLGGLTSRCSAPLPATGSLP